MVDKHAAYKIAYKLRSKNARYKEKTWNIANFAHFDAISRLLSKNYTIFQSFLYELRKITSFRIYRDNAKFKKKWKICERDFSRTRAGSAK